MTDMVATSLSSVVIATLPNDRYRTEYRDAPRPKKVTLDSAYGLCFRMCLVHFLEEIEKRSPVRKYGSKLNMPPRCLEWVVTVSCIAACDRYWFPMAGADYPANSTRVGFFVWLVAVSSSRPDHSKTPRGAAVKDGRRPPRSGAKRP